MVTVPCCQTFSHLSPFGLKTWIERLLPDVKKQPLGITGAVLCVLKEWGADALFRVRIFMIIIHMAQVVDQGGKKSPISGRTFLYSFILKARNSYKELFFSS